MDNSDELKNENPVFLINLFQYFTEFLANYGWYLLLASIACIYFYTKVCKAYLENYWRQKSESEYAAKYHKNPDLYRSRILSMEEARKKMQERYDKEVEEFQVKQKLKEEKKRQEWLERNDPGSSGHKLGNAKEVNNDDKKKPLRSDYNPLMGDASGSSYRAPKRSACGGGGCGK